MGAVHGTPCIRMVRIGVGAFIEAHGNVRAECLLDLHHLFRCEQMLAPVDVRTERDAILVNVVDLSQAEHLKPSAVGQDRSVPTHKIVKATCFPYQFMSRSHIQVVRVGKDDLRLDLLEILRCHRLDGRLRADRHIDGRFNHAVRRVKLSKPRARLLAGMQ